MGQVALGFRSLLIKLAVFFVMAALLAWALGGTLWPRAEIADLDRVSYGGQEWFWRLTVGGRDDNDGVRWTLMRCLEADAPPSAVGERLWSEVAGPVATSEGLYYAGRPIPAAADDGWLLECMRSSGGANAPGSGSGIVARIRFPDRLEVERQLERARAGLDVQDPDESSLQRPLVLDPAAPAPGD